MGQASENCARTWPPLKSTCSLGVEQLVHLCQRKELKALRTTNTNDIQCTLGENYAPACADITGLEKMQARERNGPVVKLKMGQSERIVWKAAGRDGDSLDVITGEGRREKRLKRGCQHEAI